MAFRHLKRSSRRSQLPVVLGKHVKVGAGQQLLELALLALLGGVLGLGLAAVVLHLLNESQFVAFSHFGLSWRAFAWGLALTVAFGLMSGVYPAWKMARLNPVDALRGSGGGPR